MPLIEVGRMEVRVGDTIVDYSTVDSTELSESRKGVTWDVVSAENGEILYSNGPNRQPGVFTSAHYVNSDLRILVRRVVVEYANPETAQRLREYLEKLL